jgi:hypothetical protein
MDPVIDFLARDFVLFGMTVQYWTLIALALMIACMAAAIYSKKI